MPRIHKRESAKRDLVKHFVYLAEEAGSVTAERFLVSVNESLEALARMPSLGPLVQVNIAKLSGIRKWRVGDFENFLIIDLPLEDRLEIVRAIHAAQDWMRMLEA